MPKVLNLVNPFGKCEKIAEQAEYELPVGLIAVVCVVATSQLFWPVCNSLGSSSVC
jgi:hypothetical protein